MSEVKQASLAVRFAGHELNRLDFAKELLLKGWPNTTPKQAASAANQLFQLVLSAEPQEQLGESSGSSQ